MSIEEDESYGPNGPEARTVCLLRVGFGSSRLQRSGDENSEDNEIPIDDSCAVIWNLSPIIAIEVPFALFLRLPSGGRKG